MRNLSRQIDLVREELAETIHLNETLGAPPPQVMDRLMAAIDAETLAARRRRAGRRGHLADRFLCQSLAAHDGGCGILRRACDRIAIVHDR